MYFLGVDPGASGAFALLEETKVCSLSFFDKEVFIGMLDFLSHEQVKTRCCLERVHAMPKQGTVSMFHFGENFGWLQGAMDMAGIEYSLVNPQTWKKEFRLSQNKEDSISAAKELFPGINLAPGKRRVDNDNLAEALLMAEYARRML